MGDDDKKYESLFEYIREMFPTDTEYYGLGDNNTVYDDDNTPNHRVWHQSLREDKQGDVGVFELRKEKENLYMSEMCDSINVYIGVVTVNGNINAASRYLEQLYKNIRSCRKAYNLYIDDIKYISLSNLGKNSVGNQMVSLNLNIRYVLNDVNF